MFKSTKDFDAAVCEILIAFRDEKDPNDLKIKYGDADFYDALEHCFNHGFLLANVPVRRMESRRLIYGEKARITHQGLSFIERFSHP